MGLLTRILVVIIVSILCFSCWPTKDLKGLTYFGETVFVDPAVLKVNGVYCGVGDDGMLSCFALYHDGTYLDLIQT
jgi:hypothetical protein